MLYGGLMQDSKQNRNILKTLERARMYEETSLEALLQPPIRPPRQWEVGILLTSTFYFLHDEVFRPLHSDHGTSLRR
jgi:hypothetical protein